MSLFDVIRYSPIPDAVTETYLGTLPATIAVRYRLWFQRKWDNGRRDHLAGQEAKAKVLELLHNYVDPGEQNGYPSN